MDFFTTCSHFIAYSQNLTKNTHSNDAPVSIFARNGFMLFYGLYTTVMHLQTPYCLFLRFGPKATSNDVSAYIFARHGSMCYGPCTMVMHLQTPYYLFVVFGPKATSNEFSASIFARPCDFFLWPKIKRIMKGHVMPLLMRSKQNC